MLNTELTHGTVLSTHLTHYQTHFAQSFGYQSYQDMFATLIPKFGRVLNFSEIGCPHEAKLFKFLGEIAGLLRLCEDE